MSEKARQSLFEIQKALEKKLKPPVSTFAPTLVESDAVNKKNLIKANHEPLPLYKPIG